MTNREIEQSIAEGLSAELGAQCHAVQRYEDDEPQFLINFNGSMFGIHLHPEDGKVLLHQRAPRACRCLVELADPDMMQKLADYLRGIAGT